MNKTFFITSIFLFLCTSAHSSAYENSTLIFRADGYVGVGLDASANFNSNTAVINNDGVVCLNYTVTNVSKEEKISCLIDHKYMVVHQSDRKIGDLQFIGSNLFFIEKTINGDSIIKSNIITGQKTLIHKVTNPISGLKILAPENFAYITGKGHDRLINLHLKDNKGNRIKRLITKKDLSISFIRNIYLVNESLFVMGLKNNSNILLNIDLKNLNTDKKLKFIPVNQNKEIYRQVDISRDGHNQCYFIKSRPIVLKCLLNGSVVTKQLSKVSKLEYFPPSISGKSFLFRAIDFDGKRNIFSFHFDSGQIKSLVKEGDYLPTEDATARIKMFKHGPGFSGGVNSNEQGEMVFNSVIELKYGEFPLGKGIYLLKQ